ncbi:MAG TPA: hypothetical protein VK907_01960 [Phnomibacter sp.]|nr:hypothetical protein [Phnomibacter sp.]
MKDRSFTCIIFFAIFCSLSLFSCNAGTQQDGYQLGSIAFDVSGKDEAKPAFQKALLLLHSFEYADAAEAFREAITIDPDMAMAYWGEAMTCIHPLWQEQDVDKGRAILNELAPTPEERMNKAGSEMEKDLLRGVEILYGEGNKVVRDSSYAAFMASLHKKYPGSDEVACFYSLSLIGWAVTSRSLSVSEDAAQIALGVLDRNPQHPGALHYVIHAWDHPEHAAKALATANKYAGVAPDAGHALHMPTHTYLALGMWNEVVWSNEVSWAADMARRDRKQLNNDALSYHSYHWLQYGALQKGDQARAKRMLDSMFYFAAAQPSPKARSHQVLMQTTYLAETNDLTEETVAMPYESKDLNVGLRAAQYFVQGLFAFEKGDHQGMETIIRTMTAERLVEADRVLDGGLRMCGNINRSLPTRTNLLESETMEAELRYLLASLSRNDGEAERWLKKACDLQAAIGYAYGPPNIVKPPNELYGEWLLEKGRSAEAIAQFDVAMSYSPNRLHSVKGKQLAERSLKDASIAVK